MGEACATKPDSWNSFPLKVGQLHLPWEISFTIQDNWTVAETAAGAQPPVSAAPLAEDFEFIFLCKGPETSLVLQETWDQGCHLFGPVEIHRPKSLGSRPTDPFSFLTKRIESNLSLSLALS